eukprot:TRINITY_DN27201_c0_g1_i2.p1 TRINITY_DN27201_c0_g1~~TRINITY_DN27201_c0_g1_i2.p1  ORF type:complete len:163 (+),score=16.83 TRINITY_DN27201_c0_g1_i2:122-610(+)
MQDLCNEASEEFSDSTQAWKVIGIYIRSLSDGCAPTLACQVAMIPAIMGSVLLQVVFARLELLHHLLQISLYLVLCRMPYLTLLLATDVSVQCEQAPQVANSIMVSERGNLNAESLLSFVSRCCLGFFINDMRVSPAGVMKYTYVLAAILCTAASSYTEQYV